MKEFQRICANIGRSLFQEEIESNFDLLLHIRNQKIQSAIDWIQKLPDHAKKTLADEIFDFNNPSDLAKKYLSITTGTIGPRYEFPDSKKLLDHFTKKTDFNFTKIDNESVTSIAQLGKFKLITTISASSKIFNIECRHSVKHDDPGKSGHFSLLRSVRLYHGDCWKSPSLSLANSVNDVEIVLNEGYRRLSEALLRE